MTDLCWVLLRTNEVKKNKDYIYWKRRSGLHKKFVSEKASAVFSPISLKINDICGYSTHLHLLDLILVGKGLGRAANHWWIFARQINVEWVVLKDGKRSDIPCTFPSSVWWKAYTSSWDEGRQPAWQPSSPISQLHTVLGWLLSVKSHSGPTNQWGLNQQSLFCLQGVRGVISN